MPPVLPGRRERMRAATLQEIKDAARELLIGEGRHAVTINAVARKIGMSGPAIYRYYSSHDDLIAGLTADFYRELTGELQKTRVEGRINLLAMCRRMRRWALDHKAEFGLMFASPPLPPGCETAAHEVHEAGHAFGQVFVEEMSAIWRQTRFPIPELETMPAGLADQLEVFSGHIEGALPAEATYVFLNCWIRLYGLLCMEVFQQLDFALTDAEPFYEECLQELCRILDVEYSPPHQ